MIRFLCSDTGFAALYPCQLMFNCLCRKTGFTVFYICVCIFNVFPDEPTKLYPFFYRPMFAILEDGWTAFRPETEYSQLVTSQADVWRISYVNKDFSVC